MCVNNKGLAHIFNILDIDNVQKHFQANVSHINKTLKLMIIIQYF